MVKSQWLQLSEFHHVCIIQITWVMTCVMSTYCVRMVDRLNGAAGPGSSLLLTLLMEQQRTFSPLQLQNHNFWFTAWQVIQAFGCRAKTEAREEKAQGSSLSTRESWLRSVVSPVPCKTLARSLGGERSRGSVPLGPWLAGCHGAEVAATPSLSPSLNKIYFISAPTLPSPK